MRKRFALLILIVAALAGGAYYYYRDAGTAETAQTPAAPPPEVGIVVAKPAEVPLPLEYAGRVAGFRDVEVRPRVGGLLLERGFAEGTKVEADQLLFRIDPAPYEVALSRAEAQLKEAQAALRQAEDEFARSDELLRRGVSTVKQRDDAASKRDQAQAAVQVAEAEIASAKLNLSYTTVNAPVSGVTALLSPPVGTLVQAQQTLLTTITQLDPAYVSFSFTDEEGQEFRALNERRATPIGKEDLTVALQYGTGRSYGLPGTIDVAAQRVDLQTGTIQARAVFPNPDGDLLPGQFVRVQVRGVTLPDAIVIPKRAVSQGPQGPSVYVVAADDTAEVRPIRLGHELAAGWVVREGLKGGERVVVDGVIRVRPGAPVKAVEIGSGPQAAQKDGSAAPARP